MKRNYANVDGIQMSWEEAGEGIPVILLHGIPTSPALWRFVTPHLSGVRVLAWEMVGYGHSMREGRGRDISVGRQAEYLVQWMRKLSIEKAIFVGHDLGGGVAQIAAVRHPQMCAGLFLTNAVGYDSWPIPSVSAMKASAPLARHMPDAVFKALLSSLFYRGHDDPAKAKNAYRTHIPLYLAERGAASLIAQVEQLHVADTVTIADQLPTLRVPARIVWGASDQFQKLEYGRRFARDLGAPLLTIKGGKHFAPEDHPVLIAQEILALVQEVRAS